MDAGGSSHKVPIRLAFRATARSDRYLRVRKASARPSRTPRCTTDIATEDAQSSSGMFICPTRATGESANVNCI
jgi:hypothetical protein